jgi:hypothetical protein
MGDLEARGMEAASAPMSEALPIRLTQHYTTRCRSWGHADR